jgi:hypothetical protein
VKDRIQRHGARIFQRAVALLLPFKPTCAALVAAVLLGGAFRSDDHEYYVGVAECRYFPEAKLWVWEQKLFTDDLEGAYNLAHPSAKIRLDNALPRVDTAVSAWVLSQFRVQCGKKNLAWVLIDRVSSPESTVLRWKSRGVDPLGKSITVQHDALRAALPQQIHLVHFRRQDFRSSHSFKEPGTLWTLQIP